MNSISVCCFRANGVGFTVTADSGSGAKKGFNSESFKTGLSEKLGSGEDRSGVVEYINARVSQEEQTDPLFIRTLLTVVVESSLDGLGGPNSDIKLKEEVFQSHCTDILQKLVSGPDAELQALFALQNLMHRLDYFCLFTKFYI